MNDIHTGSQKFTFILYADDTTLISPLCSFIHSNQSDMDYVSTMITKELSKISDWFAVNKLSLNTEKAKFMLFHNCQKTINEDDIPHLTINDTIIERVTEFNFWGLIWRRWAEHNLSHSEEGLESKHQACHRRAVTCQERGCRQQICCQGGWTSWASYHQPIETYVISINDIQHFLASGSYYLLPTMNQINFDYSDFYSPHVTITMNKSTLVQLMVRNLRDNKPWLACQNQCLLILLMHVWDSTSMN